MCSHQKFKAQQNKGGKWIPLHTSITRQSRVCVGESRWQVSHQSEASLHPTEKHNFLLGRLAIANMTHKATSTKMQLCVLTDFQVKNTHIQKPGLECKLLLIPSDSPHCFYSPVTARVNSMLPSVPATFIGMMVLPFSWTMWLCKWGQCGCANVPCCL